MQETPVPPLGQEDPLEKEKATHYVFWPREFHELYSPWDHKELDMTERLSLYTQYISVCMYTHICMYTHTYIFIWYVLSHFGSVQLFVTPWTVALQSPLSMAFSRQEYWSG